MTMLKDQVALVTGAGRGIGAAIAGALATEGARVVVSDVRRELAEGTADHLRSQGFDSRAEVLDVTDRAAALELAKRVTAEQWPVSILINNAGIGLTLGLDDPAAARVWDDTIAVNLTGVFNVTHAFLPALKQTRGCIVNISSIVAFTSGFAEVGYVASKGGVRSLTQKLCRELAPHGIRVNAVAPGYIETAMGGSEDHAMLDWLAWHCPMRRFGRPEEVAGPVVFLVSPAASFVNGVTLPVDGGYLVI